MGNVVDLAAARAERNVDAKSLTVRDSDFVRATSPCGNFTLVQRPSRSSSVWTNCKLLLNVNYGKRTWNLGWNGIRFARSWESEDLAFRHPAIFEWVRSVLEVKPNVA